MSHTEPSPSVLGAMRFSFTKVPSFSEDLDAVVRPVADVDQAVVGRHGAVHRVAELLGQRRVGIVAAQVRVVGLVAVGAPVALERAGVHVEDGHALVAVAVGDVGLVGRRRRRRSWPPGRSARVLLLSRVLARPRRSASGTCRRG